jgi:hypothetical protein
MNQTNDQATTPRYSWVIYSAAEERTNGGRGYWNAFELRWTHREDATIFPADSIEGYALPMSLCQDRQWVDLSLADQQDEKGLCDALNGFCSDHGLHPQSADELLFELLSDTANASRILWLKQFQAKWEAVVESAA